MILAIDIGNTAISMALVSDLKVSAFDSVDSTVAINKVRQSIARNVRTAQKKSKKVEAVVICSVVPKVTKIVRVKIASMLNCKIYIIGKNLKVNIKNNYKNPKQVGSDRLVLGYAAKKMFGAPIISIDFGTAITFDYVSKLGAYEGGIIVPGIRLSAESLFKKTALLPKIDTIKGPKQLVGKDTRESILSGLFHGYGALCSGLIKRLKRKSKSKCRVVVTGGYTHLIKNYVDEKIDYLDPHLVFKGMWLLYEENCK